MKVCVIGGGSTYTPELVQGFLERSSSFPMTELWLMDIDGPRLEIVGNFAKRMVEAKGSPFRVILTQDRRAAVKDAAYVLTQLRVGHMQARREDEYLGRRHGLIGQETTGIGGFAKALRTIPVIMDLARDMRELAPKAVLANFTNPSGLVTQALALHAPDITAVGVCNVPYNAKMMILRQLEKSLGATLLPERGELDTLGLNHLSWHRGFKLDGEEMWPRVIEGFIADLKTQEKPEWDADTIQSLRMIPNYYLEYFYYTDHKLDLQQAWPPSRAEEVMEIEKTLLRKYADPALTAAPPELMKRGGAYYSTVATQLLNAHYNNLGERHTVNVAHQGAVPGWPKEWVLEMPSLVDRAGFHPIPAEPLPAACFGLLAQVKSYELLTVEAAIHSDRRAAYQALLAHPLGPSADKIHMVLDELLEINKPYLPGFWR